MASNGHKNGKSYLLVVFCSFLNDYHMFAIMRLRNPVKLYHATDLVIIKDVLDI